MKCIMLSITVKTSDTENTVIRLCSAPFNVEYSGYTWYAAGDLLDIGEIEQSYELITEGIRIQQSGINPEYREFVEKQTFRNAPIDVLLGDIEENSNRISSAIYYHRGFGTTPVTEIDSESGTITIAIETESAFRSLDRKSIMMTTSLAHHQSHHQDDMFFQYVANTDLKEEVWKD